MKSWRGSIRGQLLAALALLVLIAAAILAMGMTVMLRAEKDFRVLAQDRIPAVALAGELAEATGELAALAMQLVADPAMPSIPMKRAIDNASRGVEAVLASTLLQAAPERAATRREISRAERSLHAALTEFSRLSNDLAFHAQAEARAGVELRWIHADIQDQVQGILSDLSFNMDTQLATLVAKSDPQAHAVAQQGLTDDWLLRDRIQKIGSEAATLIALLLQARSADSIDVLDQTLDLGRDTLDALALAQLNLPPRADIGLLMQSLDRLKALASDEGNIFSLQQQRLGLHRAAVTELQSAQTGLARMQASLTELGRSERIGAQKRADAAAAAIRHGSTWLGMVTLLGALAAAAILAIFVHRRILLRIESLSADLRRIAKGDLSGQEESSGSGQSNSKLSDEISDMAYAVEVFRASVRQRQLAIERLEQTQRELVQAGKMAALGQMSAAISHEINQPLAAISHRLHNLAASQPDARPAIDRIEALLDRINRTIGHLRRIARRSVHCNSRVRVNEPMQAALELLEHRLLAEAVNIECAVLDGVQVGGDEILLEQVFLNVLSNALDAIAAREHPTEPGVIRIQRQDHVGSITILIRDNGVGLGGHSGLTLTDPFVTTKEAGQGLGLGLSIAFNVMQDMGGHLEIEEQPEGGALVRLRLNRWLEEANE